MITDYNQLPLGKFLEVQEVSKREDLEDIDKQVKVLAILSDLPESDILHMPIYEYKTLAEASAFLEREDTSHYQAAREYRLGGMVLVPTYDFKKLETAQYVDFQTFAPLAEVRMVELLSCLLIPKGHRYNEGYDIADVQKVIREDLSTTDAFALAAFFLHSLQILIEDTLSYCSRIMERMPKGMRSETRVQIESLRELLSRASGGGLRT